MSARNGTVVYRGPSRLDGQPIMAVLTGLARKSKNPKTGDALQLWILPENGWHGDHASVCGGCPLSPANGGGCYVAPRAVVSVWRAYQHDGASPLPLPLRKTLRLGAWGDPAALPLDLIRKLAGASVHGWTGYTHQWRRFPALRRYLMASVESAADARRAQSKGWRTFRVTSSSTPHLARQAVELLPEIQCPATTRGVSCVDCRLCDGATSNDDPRVSIAIPAHGYQVARALEVVS